MTKLKISKVDRDIMVNAIDKACKGAGLELEEWCKELKDDLLAKFEVKE